MVDNKLIVVCSKNKAKNAAVEKVMNLFFENYYIDSLETKSLVSETPIGDEEGITGCLNRISDAMEQVPNANLYVAMEGILDKNKFGTFLCGWTVIYDRDEEEYYYGCSSKVRIPDIITREFNKDTRLSEVVAKYIGSSDEVVSKIGTNGMLTNGVYTRTDEFIDSVTCAISSKYEKVRRVNYDE